MDWKLQQELSRLQLDIDNLERVTNTRIKRMKNRLNRIRELSKESAIKEINTQTKLFD